MDKMPLVLFSGGLDSTALLWRQLQIGPCDVLYVDGGQAHLKVRAELEARSKIIQYLNNTCPYKIQQDYRGGHHNTTNRNDLRYSQPIAWLVGALNVIDLYRHDRLMVGYVYDDGGFCRWLPDIATAWEAMQAVTRVGQPIPIEWPIIDYTKVELLEAIDPELIPLLWVCEFPRITDEGKIHACKGCRPCKLAKQTLANYESEHGHSIYSKMLLTRVRRDAAKAAGVAVDLAYSEASNGLPREHNQVLMDYRQTVATPLPRYKTTYTTNLDEED